MNLVKTST